MRNFTLVKKALLIFFLFATIALAIDLDKLPSKPTNSFVYDENRFMTTEQVLKFDSLSRNLFKQANVTLAIAIVNDIGDFNYKEYALETFNKWEISGSTNEGVLIFLAYKQQKYSTEIGSGAKEYLTDELITKLQEQVLVPSLRIEKYGEGIFNMAEKLADAAAKAKGIDLGILSDDDKSEEGGSNYYSFILLGLFFLFLIIVLKSRGSKSRGCLGAAVTGGALGKKPGLDNISRGGSFGGGFGGLRNLGSRGNGGNRGGGFGGGFGGGRSNGGTGGNW